MRYTIRDGAERPFSGRAKENLRYLLPLLVILVGVLFFALSPNDNKNNQKPYTLGVYTVKSPNTPAGNNNSNNSSGNDGSSSSPTTSPTALSVNTVSGLGSTDNSAPTPTVTVPVGGMGGGGDTGGSPPTSVIACDNTGGILPITCEACAPALVVPVGQKVLLSSSGSCSLLN